MKKKVMALALVLAMVLSMSLNVFAAQQGSPLNRQDGTNFKTVSKITLKDFVRLWEVCNEKYGEASYTGLQRKVVEGTKIEGTAEPVGPDDTDPQYTGKTIDVWTKTGAAKAGDPEWSITGTKKLSSMHDAVSGGRTVKFVNGKKLSDTEWVIRVDASNGSDDNEPQPFRGDYYVSVVPYGWAYTGKVIVKEKMYDIFGNEYENVHVKETEPREVPGEFNAVHNNKEYGPAWFFCMLFDENPNATATIVDEVDGRQFTQSAYSDIIGYLVARRITRWPNWDDLKYAELASTSVKWDGTIIPTPTQQGREAALNHYKDSNAWKDGEYAGTYIGRQAPTGYQDGLYGFSGSAYYENPSSYKWFSDNLKKEAWSPEELEKLKEKGIVEAD